MVSIIVPVYRVEEYLSACLDSVLMQTERDFECILIDDGSPDRSGEICDAYARRDPRFVVIHQANQGVSAARNRGIEAAKGEYLLFLDSDDRLTPDCLEALLACMQEGVDLALCEYRRVDETGALIGDAGEGELALAEHFSVQTEKESIPADDRALAALWECGGLYSCWGKLYRSDLIRETGLIFDTKLTFAEDMRFAAGYAKFCRQIAVTARPLYLYLWREGSLTTAPKPGMLRQRYDSLTAIAEEYALAGKLSAANSVRNTRDCLTPEAFLERMDDPSAQLALMREYCGLENYREMLAFVKRTRAKTTWLAYATRSPRLLRILLLWALKRRARKGAQTQPTDQTEETI